MFILLTVLLSMLVTTDETRTFVEALVFSLSGMRFGTLYLCALSAEMINKAAFYNLYNIFIIVDSSR